MKPNYTAVEHCRVCGHDNIENLNVEKSYYLMNLDLKNSFSKMGLTAEVILITQRIE
tara:strand:- start:600 stop:770 length:171 start_codon:yes stop_codon:yes gene_type:complete